MAHRSKVLPKKNSIYFEQKISATLKFAEIFVICKILKYFTMLISIVILENVIAIRKNVKHFKNNVL